MWSGVHSEDAGADVASTRRLVCLLSVIYACPSEQASFLKPVLLTLVLKRKHLITQPVRTVPKLGTHEESVGVSWSFSIYTVTRSYCATCHENNFLLANGLSFKVLPWVLSRDSDAEG